VLTFAALERVDGCPFCCEQACAGVPTPTPFFDAQGRQIFEMKAGQFMLVVEAAPGLNGSSVANTLGPAPPDGRPDLQIQNTLDMGDGSLTVCDKGPPSQGGGGVPGIAEPSFDPDDEFITDALVDFACRFTAFTAAAPCTIMGEGQDPTLIDPNATAQFCNILSPTTAFPPGESLVTVAVRDMSKQLGPTVQIIVRVETPIPP
jgi:hypothetical protein